MHVNTLFKVCCVFQKFFRFFTFPLILDFVFIYFTWTWKWPRRGRNVVCFYRWFLLPNQNRAVMIKFFFSKFYGSSLRWLPYLVILYKISIFMSILQSTHACTNLHFFCLAQEFLEFLCSYWQFRLSRILIRF